MDKGQEPVAYHDALASGWDGRYSHGSFARRARFFAGVILPLLPVKGNWLDAGCGTGTFSRMLIRQEGRSVAGVDASANMVMEATKMAAVELTDGRLSFNVVPTIQKLPFPEAHFDGVTCLSVLEYLERPLEALDELIRVLKPGGTIALSVPHRSSAIRLGQKLYDKINPSPLDKRRCYIRLSTFASTPRMMEGAMMERGADVLTMKFFDPFIPRLLYPLLKPSLIYIVGRKRA